jgi:hypothetical protein
MLCALVSVEPESELLDASQSLKFRRVDQTPHQLAFVGIGAKANDVMNRIAIDSFGQEVRFLLDMVSLGVAKFITSTPMRDAFGAHSNVNK